MGAAYVLAGQFPGRPWTKSMAPALASEYRPAPDLEISLKATGAAAPILPGSPTGVWVYDGEVRHGARDRLQKSEQSYLGPTIRVQSGERLRIHLTNDLPQETIIHWHGLHLPDDMDGHPRYAVPQGGRYLYEFHVLNRAGTYWYHPHPHGLTGPQVYGGLAGLFLVSDAEEEALGLPSGEFEAPLVIQDRTFDRRNQLVYLGSGMMERMNGFLGEVILVNGRPNATLSVASHPYRLRVLNGSNSRIYRLAWSDGRPLVVIGTDGGLLERPIARPYVMLGPGERLDLWADFSRYPVGGEIFLISLPFDAGGGMMMGSGGAPPNGALLTILRVRVERPGPATRPLPERLSRVSRHRLDAAVNRDRPRRFVLGLQGMAWRINGRLFEMTGVAPDETVQLGDLEVWEFVNAGGRGMGMMGHMSLPHPIHLHGLQFQVLDRQGGWTDGFLDEGWKDTVLVMPGQRVRLLVKFEDFTGLYLYHCHNLEHEDMGMMRNYLVRR